MKKILFLGLCMMGLVSSAFAGAEDYKTVIVHESTSELQLEINDQTLKTGYNPDAYDHRWSTLKLAGFGRKTALSHSEKWDDVVVSADRNDVNTAGGKETLIVKTTLEKHFQRDTIQKLCKTTLLEIVEVEFRGVRMQSVASEPTTDRNMEHCAGI